MKANLKNRIASVLAVLELATDSIENQTCAADEERGRYALMLAHNELYEIHQCICRESRRIENGEV